MSCYDFIAAPRKTGAEGAAIAESGDVHVSQIKSQNFRANVTHSLYNSVALFLNISSSALVSLMTDIFEDVFCGILARANIGPPAAGRAGNDDDEDDEEGRKREGEGRAALEMDGNGLVVVLLLAVRDVGLS